MDLSGSVLTMNNTKKQKAIQSSMGIVTALLLFLSAGLKLPLVDAMTDAYFQKAITKAGIAYATCRTLGCAGDGDNIPGGSEAGL
jgi:hypothetical protein